MNLHEILCEITKKKLQVRLFTGFADACGGYGWHVRYFIIIDECIEFCSKCRDKYRVNYKEDFDGRHHRHSHRQEYKSIYSKQFIVDTEEKICKDLIQFLNQYTPPTP
jgi:hypothetical protein